MNWVQTKINLNNFFKDFSKLKLFKISLNIQIQTKSLNEGFLEWFKKDFEITLKSFQKVKPTKG
jgi:hypothetical protein